MYKSGNILLKLGPEWFCEDNDISIRYEQLFDTLNRLDEHFNRGIAQCLSISVQNNVDSAILLLFLISRKFNFFLNGSSALPNDIPHFCDKILTFNRKGNLDCDLITSIKLIDNVNATKQKFIKPGSGYIYFASSGTMGKPKFVKYSSANLILNAKKIVDRFRINSSNKILISVPMSHMYGFGVGFLPSIIAGSSFCLIDRNNIIKLYEKLRSFNPNITLIIPSICKMILKLGKKIPSETLFVTAGDRISDETYSLFESKVGRLINLYGCTELGAIATSPLYPVKQENINRLLQPLENVSFRISENYKGEIYCKHDAGFESYVNTAGEEMFNDSSDSWFRTKDLGIRVGSNQFKVLDRVGNSVKRLGFLVTFHEIETLLEDLFEEIDQVVIVADERESVMGKILVAFCKIKNNYKLDETIVKNICENKIKKHLIPDMFYFMNDLPLLNNGKPNRLSLMKIINI